jgi:hypothetical protein
MTDSGKMAHFHANPGQRSCFAVSAGARSMAVQLVIQPMRDRQLAGLTDSREGRRGRAGTFLK